MRTPLLDYFIDGPQRPHKLTAAGSGVAMLGVVFRQAGAIGRSVKVRQARYGDSARLGRGWEKGWRSAAAGRDGCGHGLGSYVKQGNHRLRFEAQRVGWMFKTRHVDHAGGVAVRPIQPETVMG